jgi:hypothetical protein
MVAARLRLVQQLGHLAGSLNITGMVWKVELFGSFFPTIFMVVAGNDGANGVYNRLNSGFSGCVETMKTGIENEVMFRLKPVLWIRTTFVRIRLFK